MASLIERKLNSFHCANCDSLLTCPVMLVERIGNVCSACFEKHQEFQSSAALRNEILEYILKAVGLPCQNRETGCLEVLKYDDYLSHIPKCLHQSIKCLHKSDCSWRGLSDDLIAHLNKAHRNRTLYGKENLFKIPVSELTGESYNLLNATNGTYLCHVKHYEDKVKILFYMPQTTLGNTPALKIHLTTEEGSKTTLNCKTTSNIKHFLELFEDLATEAVGKFLISDVMIQIDSESEISASEERMLRLLECQVCKIYMRPPIFQCTQGHDICHTCKTKVTKCPTCAKSYAETRNYTLETLVSQFKYPCEYEDFGCNASSLLSENHEASCSFRPWSCPITSCRFVSCYSDLTYHVREAHESLFNISDTEELQAGDDSTHYFIINNRIIELIHSTDVQNYTWSVRLIAPWKLPKYRCEISFVSHTESKKEFSIITICEYSEQAPKKIVLPKDSLKDFISGSVSHIVKLSIHVDESDSIP